jgi:hypothetical protein
MSGWATVTAKANSPEEAEELRDAFTEITERDDDARISNSDPEEVHILDWGYGSSESKRVLTENADLWLEAVVMECNDTTDSGSGRVYESDGTRRGVEKVDSAGGYEGARGHDAAGKLSTTMIGHPYMR